LPLRITKDPAIIQVLLTKYVNWNNCAEIERHVDVTQLVTRRGTNLRGPVQDGPGFGVLLEVDILDLNILNEIGMYLRNLRNIQSYVTWMM
jgi:hypothetical protein